MRGTAARQHRSLCICEDYNDREREIRLLNYLNVTAPLTHVEY